MLHSSKPSRHGKPFIFNCLKLAQNATATTQTLRRSFEKRGFASSPRDTPYQADSATAPRWRASSSSAPLLPDSYPPIIPGPTKETICTVTFRIVPSAEVSKLSEFRATARRFPALGEGFGGDHVPVWDDDVVCRLSPKPEIVRRAAAKYVPAALTEIGRVVDEGVA